MLPGLEKTKDGHLGPGVAEFSAKVVAELVDF
jgi:hypothetical protein